MKQHMGTDNKGRRMFREVFVDMTTGKECGGGVDLETGQEKGWNGEPEGIPNNPIHSASERFRENYSQIIWESKYVR